LRRETHQYRKLSVRLQYVGRDRPAHRRLDSGVDVANSESETRRHGAVDANVEIWLSDHMEHAKILDAWNAVDDPHHLLGQPFENVEIGADDLDRIGAFDARQRLLDIVLYVLREIEIDSRKLLLELLFDLLGQLFLGEPGGHSSKGLRGRRVRHWRRGGVGAIVGRPC